MDSSLSYIIIDDEPPCRSVLRNLMLMEYPTFTLLAECKDGIEGLKKIESLNPDFIFLDVAMPRMNGFEMLSKIDNPNFEIIFTTAFDQFAIEAFKVSAIDYLLKPIAKNELTRAVEKVLIRLTSINKELLSLEYIKLFLQNITTNTKSFPNIALPVLNGLEMVKVEDIMYATSDINYTNIIFVNNDKKVIAKTLKEFEKLVNGHPFARIHRSVLINLKYLKQYVKGEGGYVILSNGEHFDVSRRRKEGLLKMLKKS